jgi:DNA-binding NarL/FixJ family response regulator
MDPARRSKILTAYAGHSRRFDEIASRRGDEPDAPGGSIAEVDRLSERQFEVLSLMAEGFSNNEICAQLDVALETVKTHVLHIFQRLHARNRAHAVHLGHQHGLFD